MQREIIRGQGGLYMLIEPSFHGGYRKVVYVSASLFKVEEELRYREARSKLHAERNAATDSSTAGPGGEVSPSGGMDSKEAVHEQGSQGAGQV